MDYSKKSPNPNMEQENIEDYESEDVISLCDLPIYSSSDTTDHEQELYQSSSILLPSFSSDDQENFFEFFSEEWNISNKITVSKSNSLTHDENIIFCGKIFPSNRPLSNEPNSDTQKVKKIPPKSQESQSSLKKSVQKAMQEGSNERSLIPWKSNSIFSRSKRQHSSGLKNKELEPKVVIFTSPVKLKLLHVLFGLPPKVPTDHMELMNDIRNRQSRRAPSTLFPSDCGEKVVAVQRRRSSENGLWRFIRAAMCFGGQLHGNAVV